MNKANTDLPNGWLQTNLGTVINPSNEKSDPSGYKGAVYIGLEHIEKGSGKLLESGTSDDVKSTKSIFHKGDLLYGKLRPYLNKLWLADRDGICSTDILVFSKNQFVSNDFLRYRLLSRDFVLFANQQVSGIELPRVNINKISPYQIFLPPLHEQHRIVTKIEELFTQLDAGVASLKKVQAQLKRYRQAVLRAAFEGRLTQEWREEHKKETKQAMILTNEIIETRRKNLKGKNHNLPDLGTSELSSLSDGWIWTRLDFVCNKIQDGMHFSPPIQYDQPLKGRYPYITAKNIKNSGIDLTGVTYIDEKYHKGIFERCNPEYNDVLLTKDGVKTGEVCVNQFKEEFSLLSSVALLKPNKDVLHARFLKYYLASPVGFSMIVGQMTGVAIKRIILEKIKKSPIIVPSLPEQQVIVSEIERRLSIADEVDVTITTSLRQAETLRQSILKRAFEGKLVAQDPNDEPASILLERIKAEKARYAAEVKKGKTLQPKSPKRKIKNGN